MRSRRIALALLALLAAVGAFHAPTAAQAQSIGFPGWKDELPVTLENNGLQLTFVSDSGRLTAFTNKLTSESYTCTDFAPYEIRARETQLPDPVFVSSSGGPSRMFNYEQGPLAVSLAWTLLPGADFAEKTLTVTNRGEAPLTLDRITLLRLKFPFNALQPHPHMDPCDAPWLINLFLRGKRGGFYAGIQNPFAEFTQPGLSEIALGFSPGYVLAPGETFVSEPAFLGAYRKEGIYAFKELGRLQNMIEQEIGLQYPGDPLPLTQRLDQEVLDWGEVWGMQAFMQTIMPPHEQKQPGYYLRAIGPVKDVEHSKQFAREMKELGHIQHIEWNTWLQREDPGSPALWTDAGSDTLHLRPNAAWQEMVRYANSIGIYSGTMDGQPHPGLEANTSWIRRWPDGSIMRTSRAMDQSHTRKTICFANRSFFDWYLNEYNTLVNEYDLYMLAWDDYGGYYATRWFSGYECFDTSHGHPAGDVQYYTWRNWSKFLADLHRNEPRLALRVASGLQRGYPWILKDMLEHHTDYYDYGPGGSWWRSANYRFIPPYKATTTLAARGWGELRYNMFRSFSIAPQAMIWGVDIRYGWPGLPEDDEQRAFFRKWMQWASDNVAYLRTRRDIFREPWGDKRLDAVHVDMEANFPWDDPGLHGSAHCIGDRGFLFIFNPSTQTRVAEIPVNHWLGLTSGDAFALTQVFPEEGAALGSYARGETAKLAVPADTCMIVQIAPHSGDAIALPAVPADAPVDPAFYTWDAIPWAEIAAKP